MEARRFGFADDLPPAFKFDPTDSDIVTHYLLPRALGLQSEHEHAIIDDDPGKCPPWELMRRHGHAGSDHAFFFAPPRNPVKMERATRAVPPGEEDGVGGVWRGQKGQVGTLFLTRGGEEEEEIEIKYKRFNLTYYRDGEEKKTSGWVMHEYQIVQPPLQPGAVLARVKITDAAKKGYRQQQRNAAEAAQMFVPHQVQPVPGPNGDYYHAAAMAGAGAGAGTSGGAQAGAVDQGDDAGGVVIGEEPTFSYSDLINACQGDYYDGVDNSYFTGDMSNHFNFQGADAGGSNYGSTSGKYPYYNGGELAT